MWNCLWFIAFTLHALKHGAQAWQCRVSIQLREEISTEVKSQDANHMCDKLWDISPPKKPHHATVATYSCGVSIQVQIWSNTHSNKKQVKCRTHIYVAALSSSICQSCPIKSSSLSLNSWLCIEVADIMQRGKKKDRSKQLEILTGQWTTKRILSPRAGELKSQLWQFVQVNGIH